LINTSRESELNVNEIVPGRPGPKVVPATTERQMNLAHLGTAGPIEGWRLRRYARLVLFEEQLEYLRRATRLDNLTRLQRQQIAHSIALAEDVLARMVATDNPLVERALQEAYDNWLVQSRQIVSGFTR
jgi:hypothetical protein